MNTNALRFDSNPAPLATQDVALVRVHGRRVSWSLTPAWSPSAAAFGPHYVHSKIKGLAGSERGRASEVVRDTLRRAARGVIVYGIGERIAFVSSTSSGVRTAWSETDAWAPHLPPTGREYEAARALGLAGVEYGVRALDEVLSGERSGASAQTATRMS